MVNRKRFFISVVIMCIILSIIMLMNEDEAFAISTPKSVYMMKEMYNQSRKQGSTDVDRDHSRNGIPRGSNTSHNNATHTKNLLSGTTVVLEDAKKFTQIKVSARRASSAFYVGCDANKAGANNSSGLLILVWPGGYNFHRMGQGTCQLHDGRTCEISMNKDDLVRSDAIMLDGYNLRTLPTNISRNRLPHQKLIYHQPEAPYISWRGGRDEEVEFTHAFNLTSTYAFDSDIPFWEKEEMTLELDKAKLIELEKSGRNYAANKTRMVAWFVGHCHAPSKRQDYAKDLRTFVPVDIMGKCGDGSIGCGSRMHYKQCDSEFLSAHYKFYLSFENSICQDYVTEKLWRIISNKEANVIPIVLGGADYSSMLPPKTYIDVKDFSSPKEMSKFLMKIHLNDSMYNEYIRNKLAIIPKYVPYNCGSKSCSYASRLCRHLHDTRGQNSVVGEYGDVTEYWNKDKICITLSQLQKKPENLAESNNASVSKNSPI